MLYNPKDMKSTLLKDILDLSPAERIQLVQDIWDSISELPSTSDLTDEQKATLDRRLVELEKDPQIGLPWEEVVEAIRASRWDERYHLVLKRQEICLQRLIGTKIKELVLGTNFLRLLKQSTRR